MQRRELLALGTLGVVSLAGCTAEFSRDDDTQDDADDDDGDNRAPDDLSDDDDPAAADDGDTPTDDEDDESTARNGSDTGDSLEDLDREDVVTFVSFDPVVNEVFVELAEDPPVDEIVLSAAVAEETRTVAPADADATQSLPVHHEGDTLTISAIVNGSEEVLDEEEWNPPTSAAFEEERRDTDDRVVADIDIVDDDLGYTARVNFVEDIAATEIQIESTVAQGRFSSDTLEGLSSANVQINAVEDEVTVTATIDGEEEVVHREHLEPSAGGF